MTTSKCNAHNADAHNVGNAAELLAKLPKELPTGLLAKLLEIAERRNETPHETLSQAIENIESIEAQQAARLQKELEAKARSANPTTVDMFASRHLRFEDVHQVPLSLPTIYQLYRDYCSQLTIEPLTRNRFTNQIQRLGFRKQSRPLDRPTLCITNAILDDALHDRYVELEIARAGYLQPRMYPHNTSLLVQHAQGRTRLPGTRLPGTRLPGASPRTPHAIREDWVDDMVTQLRNKEFIEEGIRVLSEKKERQGWLSAADEATLKGAYELLSKHTDPINYPVD